MGAILAVGISLDLPVGIGPGTHGLGLQGLLFIGRRHLAGHYLCQVILQIQIIDQNQSLRRSLDFQAPAVNRHALAPLNGADGDCLRLIRRDDHASILQIRAVGTNRKLRACLQALSHHLSLGILIFQISTASQHQVRGCMEHTLKACVHQKDADGLGIKFPLQKGCAQFSIRRHKFLKVIAHQYVRRLQHLKIPVYLIYMEIGSQRNLPIAFYLNGILCHGQHLTA